MYCITKNFKILVALTATVWAYVYTSRHCRVKPKNAKYSSYIVIAGYKFVRDPYLAKHAPGLARTVALMRSWFTVNQIWCWHKMPTKLRLPVPRQLPHIETSQLILFTIPNYRLQCIRPIYWSLINKALYFPRPAEFYATPRNFNKHRRIPRRRGNNYHWLRNSAEVGLFSELNNSGTHASLICIGINSHKWLEIWRVPMLHNDRH